MPDLSRLVSLVRPFVTQIDNGRTMEDMVYHAVGECNEILEELDEGNMDRIVEEGVDVIACMMDLIITAKPDITDEEVGQLLQTACEKWARRYKDSVEGDRTID